jgi:hypothetical protein
MQKEKEVTQLQAELERLNSQISNNARDAVGYVDSLCWTVVYTSDLGSASKERTRKGEASLASRRDE